MLFGPQRSAYIASKEWFGGGQSKGAEDGEVHPYLPWVNYLLFTPLQLLLADLLERLIDSPGKQFASDVARVLAGQQGAVAGFWQRNWRRVVGFGVWMGAAWAVVAVAR